MLHKWPHHNGKVPSFPGPIEGVENPAFNKLERLGSTNDVSPSALSTPLDVIEFLKLKLNKNIVDTEKDKWVLGIMECALDYCGQTGSDTALTVSVTELTKQRDGLAQSLIEQKLQA